MAKGNENMPRELWHWLDTDEYKQYIREKRIKTLENIVFVLLLITLIGLSFTFGRLWEQSKNDNPYKLKSEFKIEKDLRWKI